MKKNSMSMKAKTRLIDLFIYLLLIIISIVWVIPILFTVMTAFRAEMGTSTSLLPKNGFTLYNFLYLLGIKDRYTIANGKVVMNYSMEQWPYLRWVINTLIVSILSMIISTIFVLSVSYAMSRLRFKARKKLMSINLILGMFPGFMALAAIYNILKLINATGANSTYFSNLMGLVIANSASAGMGFYIAKGFFDTIPKSMDEAARIDGASNMKIFFKITLPLSKPIIVYTLLTSFMGPWVSYILPAYICGTDPKRWTMPLGVYNMQTDLAGTSYRFTLFFAGSVLVSIPIVILFLMTQKYYVSGVTGGAVKG